MRVLITRPREEAAALAGLLAARGVESLVDPLLEIRPRPGTALPLEGVQGLVFTSANGVRAFAEREPARDLPVYAVGERTAEVAIAAGFTRVESAQGAVPELARLIRQRIDPRQGALLHGAGAAVAGELAGLLAEDGFEVRRVVLYDAVPANALSPATMAALEAGTLDAVLFFSPRTAAGFVSLVRAAGLGEKCRRLRALCLSPAVTAEAGALAWRQLSTAARPEQSALLALLAEPAGGSSMSERASDTPQGTGSAAGSAPATASPRVERLATPSRFPRGLGLHAAVWAAVLALLVLAGALSLPYWRPVASPGPSAATNPPPPPASDGGLAERLDALNKSVQALQQRAGEREVPPKPAAPDAKPAGTAEPAGKDAPPALGLAGAEARIAVLERAVAELAARPRERAGAEPGKLAALADELASLKGETARLGQETAALLQRLAVLESAAKQGTEAGAPRVALVLAVGQLREALQRSLAYEKPLAAVAALAERDGELEAALAALKPRAGTGVPTLFELRERFDGVSVAAARAAIEPARPGWIGETLARLSRLVVIRRTDGDVNGEGPEAALARAEARLKAGDLAASVAALGGLQGAPAEAVKPWLEEARARLAAESALAALAARAVARLGESRS